MAQQALSLQCDICGVQLRSVQEAEAHGEATGHAAFSESTQAVLRLVCSECGKVCRSDTERDLHTKRTGHGSFEDKTAEAGAIDTEAQMQEARVEAAGGEPSSPSTAEPPELVPAEVKPELLQQLEEMGFGTNRATRALYESGNESADAAVTWLMEHGEDVGLDDGPVMVPKAQPSRKLSAEEARTAAAELLRKAKEKREKEKRELERLREQERIRAGKELALAARQEDDLKFKRLAEQRRLEKEEEERARARIKQKLEEDRRERRRKLGLPEEQTEAEKEEERRKLEAQREEMARKKLPVALKPVELGEKMRLVLVGMKKAHPGQDEAVKTCWQTLFKFCANVANSPGEEKFRRIRLSNPAVAQRVAAFTGAVDFLEMAGFKRQEGGEGLEMPADGVNPLVLQTAGEQLQSAMSNPFFGML